MDEFGDLSGEQLLADLRRGPTDLARLVQYVLVRQPPRVWVSARAVDGWRRRDPEAWAKVVAWLKEQAVTVETV
jgi:hypothetical protein